MATVEDLISDARQYASDAVTDAQRAISQANREANRLRLVNKVSFNYENTLLEPKYDSGIGNFLDRYISPTNNATTPVFQPILIPEKAVIPDTPILATDNLFTIDRPAYDVTSFDEVAPDVDVQGLKDDVNALTPPNIQTVDQPVISELTLDSVPDVTLPVFTATKNIDNVGTPEDYAAELTKQYDKSLPELKSSISNWVQEWFNTYAPNNATYLQQLEDKIAEDMADARAMPDTFETNLFNRARSRAEREKDRVVADLERNHEKRGFIAPPGSFIAGLNKAQQATANMIGAQAGEIAIERARLEIQHIQFVMQLSASIRQNLQGLAIQYANTLVSINGQALEHAKLVAQYLVEAYRVLIERGRLQIAVYQVEAEVYETELKSALSVLDSYRLELEAERLKKDVEGLNVEVYSKLISAQEIEINKYLALLKGVSEKASIERLAIELYEEQAKAYVTRIQGKEAEFNAYRAAIDGDKGKLEGELAKVDIFRAQLDGEKIRADINRIEVDSTVQHNRNLVDQYEAELRAYMTEVDAEGKRFAGNVEARKVALSAFQINLQTQLETFKVKYDKARLDLEAEVQRMQKNLDIALKDADLTLKSVEIQADTAIAGAGVHGNIAAASLGSQNTMLSRITNVTQ